MAIFKGSHLFQSLSFWVSMLVFGDCRFAISFGGSHFFRRDDGGMSNVLNVFPYQMGKPNWINWSSQIFFLKSLVVVRKCTPF